MPRGDVFVNDQTTYRATIKDANGRTINLADPQVTEDPMFLFVKPDGTSFERVATLTTDGSDGQVQYSMVGGEQDQAGVWQIQVIVVFGNGTFSSDVRNQHVQPKLGI